MSNPNFIDHVRLYCRSGKGGAGASHFRRERHVPKGGPDGGDGGNGGDVVLRCNPHHWTLLHLRYRKHIRAEDGQPGGGQGASGAAGKPAVLEVPPGTQARDEASGALLAEVQEAGEEKTLLAGGKGGLGNQHFATSTNRAPHYAQPGEPAAERLIVLELKLLADVGLVGFPNAGKSTLLSTVSAAEPKVANYAFTTLVPQLGVVPYYDERSFVMTDIPGIIEGAAEGRGLGTRFLRHIERNAALLFVVPADAENIAAEYRILLGELEQHNPDLLHKKRLLGISKADLLDTELRQMLEAELPAELPAVFFSAVSGAGIEALKQALMELLAKAQEASE